MTAFLHQLATAHEAVLRGWAFRRAQRHASVVFGGATLNTGTLHTLQQSAQSRTLAQAGGLNPSFHCQARSEYYSAT